MASENVTNLINSAPKSPGVYRFLDKDGIVLYVGKAKSLINRLKNYLQTNKLSKRIARMVFYANSVIWTETLTELDALLLEAKLIKEISPKYNILLKDDKSFPFIKITKDKYPKIEKFRGKFNNKEFLIGPFTSGKSLDAIIDIVTQIFKIRTCANSFFHNRKRPCLRYSIGRCTAPCVNQVSREDYIKQIANAKSFLKGGNTGLIKDFTKEMQKASQNQEFEKAAIFRDKIQFLKDLFINNKGLEDTHVITIYHHEDTICIRVTFYEGNINLGAKTFIYPYQEDALESFLIQFYHEGIKPREVLLNNEIPDIKLYENAFSVKINVPQKGFKKEIVKKCEESTQKYLQEYISSEELYQENISKIQTIFQLNKKPINIEVYDNTHMHGSNAYGGVVVFKDGKFIKSEYRLYKIENSNSDDYAMLKNVLFRRFGKDKTPPPDLLLIDGGIGQFNSVDKALQELNIGIDIIAIAKGVNRNAFDETFFSRKVKNFKFNKSNQILFFFEKLRDEVHNYVISANRRAFNNNIKKSVLNDVPGIGKNKKKALLNHFGSIECIKNAKLEDIMKVEGIGLKLAQTILDFFNH